MSQSMHKITFISTVHEEIGKCNSDKLFALLEGLSPEVIFLEALEDTYSSHAEMAFSSFGVYHPKLEIRAIQKYSSNHSVEYIPVLDNGLSKLFDNKYDLLCKNTQLKKMLDHFNSLAGKQGLEFLNSKESTDLQEEMRTYEQQILNNHQLNQAVNEDIDSYEDSMMRNIYTYCGKNQFDRAVFMCGVAHRNSIIQKIDSISGTEKVNLNWEIYGKERS